MKDQNIITSPQKKNVSVFNRDVSENGSYAYTANHLSSMLANARITHALDTIYPVQGKRLLDLGCGDGTYSIELARLGAGFVVGIDPAETAIAAAKEKAKQAGVAEKTRFEEGNIYSLDIQEHFDCIVLRGVLHHLPDQGKAISAIASLSEHMLIVEPNGTNPVLKILEKFSAYHIEHEEQSFLLSTIKQWLHHAGFKQVTCHYVNLVPMFCPDWMARTCKIFEPIVEKMPLVRNIACGQYIILSSK